MGIATAVVSVIMLICVVFFVVAAVRAARAVNRGVERASLHVRRRIDETGLKVKAVQPGVVGQLSRLRLELRTSVETARSELSAGVVEDGSLRESLVLLDQLHEHARALDRELAGLAEREPERSRVASRLPELRGRVAEIRESADSLRHAAQERASQHDDEGLAQLREQIDIESGALRHWVPAAGSDQASGGDPDGSWGPPAQGEAQGDEARTAGRNESADARERLTKDAPREVDAPAESSTRWDASALWQARTQIPGFRRNSPSRDVS